MHFILIFFCFQFTLDVTFKGRKPDFHNAMKSDLSRSFYNIFLEALSTDYNPDKIKGWLLFLTFWRIDY